MQTIQRQPNSQPQPVKIYNAVYSSVQVYECMVRGIAVMRRRADSYVNATQILKVAGVDKGRRTKILEKEILPGKHEIVQGGYGKYQGTWIPLERGRDIAMQYGVAPLLSPLFDFVPSSTSLGAMNSTGGGNYLPSALPSAPIMPGSALRLLNQGRAQGLFTPSTSINQGHIVAYPSPGGGYTHSPAPTGVSPTPPPIPSLKRTRTDVEGEPSPSPFDSLFSQQFAQMSAAAALAASPDIQMGDVARPSSAAPALQLNGEEGPSPTKRARTEPPHLGQLQQALQRADSLTQLPATQPASRAETPTLAHPNGVPRTDSTISAGAPQDQKIRLASKPTLPRGMDPAAPLKDARRAAVVTTICQRDDAHAVLELLRELDSVDAVLDDLGHTALHIAASVGRLGTVEALLAAGADVHRGNYNGETALMRASLVSNNFDAQSFGQLVALLHVSLRTLDTSNKSLLHHIVALAGVRHRAIVARYYLDQVFLWIAEREEGRFAGLVDVQDVNGDTALNVAARVGNRSLVRTLLDVGANRILPNKLGLRPGDFGVENEELGGGPRVEDLIASLRSGPSIPAQKSQDVVADMTSMIQGLSSDFSSEIKTKQDGLDVTQAHLRAATRELSEQRRQIQAWTARCAALDQVRQRMRNVERAIGEEDAFDWTGRSGPPTAGRAFQWRGKNSTMAGLSGLVDVSFNLDVEPTVPLSDTAASLVRLRRLKMWHARMEELMEDRLRSLRGTSAEREFMCRRIVALCTGVPVDKVEEMLDDLVIAVESETQVVDIGRVSGFMQKVRDGVI